jgi:hypothetical protein
MIAPSLKTILLANGSTATVPPVLDTAPLDVHLGIECGEAFVTQGSAASLLRHMGTRRQPGPTPVRGGCTPASYSSDRHCSTNADIRPAPRQARYFGSAASPALSSLIDLLATPKRRPPCGTAPGGSEWTAGRYTAFGWARLTALPALMLHGRSPSSYDRLGGTSAPTWRPTGSVPHDLAHPGSRDWSVGRRERVRATCGVGRCSRFSAPINVS